MEFDIAPHVEEIKRALDNVIDNTSITEDLKKLLTYRVPIGEAKRSLIKKYGGAEKSIFRKLKDIEIGDRSVEVIGQILEITKKTISIASVEKTIFSGILSDETAARSFTAWEDFDLNVGDVIKVTNAYVRNWQDRPQVNFGNRSRITKLTTTIEVSPESEIKKLSELRDGEINVHTEFTIVSIESQEITTKDGTKKILSGVVADEDTKLPLTSWILSPELVTGNVIEVKNAYVRSFRGVPTLNIHENCTITGMDTQIRYTEPEKVSIGDLITRDGAFDVPIEGSILSIRPGSGLITRCPECLRVIQKGMCRAHGKVDEKSDMRIKAVIDDGTGALMLVLDAELTQQVCGLTIEYAQEMAKAAMSHKVVEEEIRNNLFGKTISARGNMSKGEFGVILVANMIRKPSDRMNERAAFLLEELADDHGKNNR